MSRAWGQGFSFPKSYTWKVLDPRHESCSLPRHLFRFLWWCDHRKEVVPGKGRERSAWANQFVKTWENLFCWIRSITNREASHWSVFDGGLNSAGFGRSCHHVSGFPPLGILSGCFSFLYFMDNPFSSWASNKGAFLQGAFSCLSHWLGTPSTCPMNSWHFSAVEFATVQWFSNLDYSWGSVKMKIARPHPQCIWIRRSGKRPGSEIFSKNPRYIGCR